MTLVDATLEQLPSVVGTINYVARAGVPPRVYYVDPPPGAPWSTLQRDPRPMTVHDVRGAEDRFTLARDGVCFPQHSVAIEDTDEAEVRSRIYPLLQAFAREVVGSDEMVITGHAARRHEYAGPEGRRSAGARRDIADFAHADQSAGAAQRLARTADPGWSGRPFSITKFWTPLAGPVYDNPLTLCLNAKAADYQPIENVYPYGIEILPGLAHVAGHRWVYKSALREGEALAFRTWDSRLTEDDVIGHVAFALPEVPADAPARHSFEFTVVAFH